jgi:Thioredoxin
MHHHITPQKTATLILIMAIVIFVGAASYNWYYKSQKTYLAGSPPPELLSKIPPKQVPYNQIKPPAITANSAFLNGSASSTYGIIFYGDYTDQLSNDLIKNLTIEISKYGDSVRLIYNYLPKTSNDGDIGYEAAVASECSRFLESNWLLHTLLIDTDAEKLKKSQITKLITNSSLEPEIMKTCQNNTTIRNQVQNNIDIAKGDGIDAAPFIFVGTQVIPASQATVENISNAIKNYLNN